MFEWIRPRFMLVLIATLGACTKPEDPSDRTARETQRNLELSQIRLDPASCPGGGDGMLYVALGDLVIRVPNFSAPTMRSPVYRGAEELHIPPMPDAPEGCKEHPARAQALHLSFLVAQTPDHVAAPLRAISVYRSEGRAHMQEINEGAFDRARARQSDCMTSPSGLTICGRREEDLPVPTGMQVAGGNVAGGPPASKAPACEVPVQPAASVAGTRVRAGPRDPRLARLPRCGKLSMARLVHE